MPNLTYRPKQSMSGRLFISDISKDPKVRVEMNKRLDRLMKAARDAAPVDTPRPGRVNVGRLKRSFRKRIDRQGFFLRGVVENTAPYAASVHDGAREHTFGPSARSHLKFFWESPPHANVPEGIARWHRTRLVHHPGIVKDSTTPFFAIAARKLGLRYVPKRS